MNIDKYVKKDVFKLKNVHSNIRGIMKMKLASPKKRIPSVTQMVTGQFKLALTSPNALE